MTIDTATGGEVASPEQLVAELKTIVAEAAAERDDAAGDAKRADEDLARIERIGASITRFKFPADDVSKVTALLDPAAMRKAAAVQRAAAADARLAGANAALTMAAKHVQLQDQGAAGEFYRA